MTARGRVVTRLVAGMALLVIGAGLVILWSAFAALYVPQCPTFSIHSADARCRTPVLWVYGGYVLGAAGVLVLTYELLRFLRRREAPGNEPGQTGREGR